MAEQPNSREGLRVRHLTTGESGTITAEISKTMMLCRFDGDDFEIVIPFADLAVES